MCGFGQGSSGSAFGTSNTGGFGTISPFNVNNTPNTSLFGQGPSNSTTNLLGGTANQPAQSQSQGLFGGSFGANNNPTAGGLFGQSRPTQSGAGLFGGTVNQQQPNTQPSNLFGTNNNIGGGLFGQSRQVTSGHSLFSQNANQQQPTGTGGLFGNTNNASGGLFGRSNQTQLDPGLFGNASTQNQACNCKSAGNSGLFGGARASNSSNTFGNNSCQSGGLFGNAQPLQRTCQFGGNHDSNQNRGLFGSNVTPTQSQGVFSTTNVLPPPEIDTRGTSAAPFEPFTEKEYSGTTATYQHICLVRAYQQHSPEELRLIDYDNGRSKPVNIFPTSPFAGFGTASTFHCTKPVASTTGCASCSATIASKDAEIRLLEAKVIILEDQLKRVIDKPEFGKSNGALLDSSDRVNKAVLLATTDIRVPNEDHEKVAGTNNLSPPNLAVKTYTVGPQPSIPNKPISNPNLAEKPNDEPKSANATKFNEECDLQGKRIDKMEAQLLKVTAILEQLALPTASSASTDENIVITEEKGKGRADDEIQSGSGTSTPAVLVYTPDSTTSTATFVRDSGIPAENKKEEATTRSGLTRGLSTMTTEELRVWATFVIRKPQLTTTEICDAAGMSRENVSLAMTELLSRGLVAKMEGQDRYKLVVQGHQ